MKRKRATVGQSLAELAAGMLVFIPIILLLADCAVVAIGVATNDSACRDAARAASSGPPGLLLPGTDRAVASGQSPYKRAKALINDVYSAGGLVKISDTLHIKETVKGPLPEAPQGGPIIGEVTVETTATVTPPFLIRAVVHSGALEFKNTQKYPYTYVMPSSGG